MDSFEAAQKFMKEVARGPVNEDHLLALLSEEAAEIEECRKHSNRTMRRRTTIRWDDCMEEAYSRFKRWYEIAHTETIGTLPEFAYRKKRTGLWVFFLRLSHGSEFQLAVWLAANASGIKHP